MSETPSDPLPETPESGPERQHDPQEQAPQGETQVFPVEFPNVPAAQQSPTRTPLNRFYDVGMTVSVELGRATMPIGELLHLAEGAVIELDRQVSEPVDVIAQGVRLARGEVVVVDDRYAVRITEIESDDSPSKSNPRNVLSRS